MENIEVKEMGFECLSFLSKLLSKQLTHEETYLNLMKLHDKYPISGHDPPLNKFQYKHHRIVKVKEISERGVHCWGCLQPSNFREAAEMYIRRREKTIDHKMAAAGETDNDTALQEYPVVGEGDHSGD